MHVYEDKTVPIDLEGGSQQEIVRSEGGIPHAGFRGNIRLNVGNINNRNHKLMMHTI